MEQTRTGREYGGEESREESVETSVVFPAPCTPFRPIVKGDEEVWWESCRRMKGMQCGDLSSTISGQEREEVMGVEVDILRVLLAH